MPEQSKQSDLNSSSSRDSAKSTFGPVQLRIPGKLFELHRTAPSRLAFYWSYVVRSRGRWQEDEELRKTLVQQAIRRFEEIGLGEDRLREIGDAGVVEVGIPYADDGDGWAVRILPWEFLLTSATSMREKPLAVIRHLQTGRQWPATGAPTSALFVENSAGAINDLYSFVQEGQWMESQLALPLETLKAPKQADLEETILRHKPDVVHLSGVDAHQGAQLGLVPSSSLDRDGLLMAGGRRAIEVVSPGELAKRLNPSGYNGAHLVAFNMQYSAPRMAAAAVSAGARAAIGFQDEIDDELAEQFFAAFYRHWRESGWDLLTAFRSSFESLSGALALHGSGIVFWSGVSQIGVPGAPIPARPEKSGQPPKTKARRKGRKLSPHEMVGVRVEAPQTINYSLLHSGERLFKMFTIYRKADGSVPPIQVEVTLQAGTDSFPYRTMVYLPDEAHELTLARTIHLSLTSRALRAVRETIRTGLCYRVTIAGEDVRCETAEVLLCPIDEWRWDSADDARWLGAFVLPRDPAVLKIIDIAQKYLVALKDDSTAGFDGYQSYDEEFDDPAIGIELQVRAIWSALAFEIPIAYVNPPPVFTEESQRLRCPSEIINGRRGTCIDLALMLAACLEYVEIYPVVFVLKDHAFPGFWRSEQAYKRFLGMQSTTETTVGGDGPDAMHFTTYDDVLRNVRSGDLVPLETVYLTQRLSFREAIEQGMENLKDRSNFGALLDVRCQRKYITPIPVVYGDT